MNAIGRKKLTEECGELITVLAKAEMLGSLGEHWDGKGPLKNRLEDEIADVLASILFCVNTNDLDVHRIVDRLREKHHLFNYWNNGGKETKAPAAYQPTFYLWDLAFRCMSNDYKYSRAFYEQNK